MKITTDRTYLLKALQTSGRAMSNRSTLPILSNVLLTTGEDSVVLMGTDLDTAIWATIPCMIERAGSIAVPGAQLVDVVSKLEDGSVSLTVEPDTCKVFVRSGNKSEIMLLALPADDFPVVPNVGEGVEIVTEQKDLRRALELTTFAASKEDTRSLLMGCLFEAKGSVLTITATDTHRLSQYQIMLSEKVEKPALVIIPSKPLTELQRIISDNAEPVRIFVGTNSVAFDAGDVRMVCRILDGQFPNAEKVIPKTHERSFTVDREELLRAVRLVYVVAKTDAEKFILDTSKPDLKGNITLSAQSSEMGTAEQKLQVEWEGKPLTTAANGRYLIELLSLLDCEKVTVNFTGALNPMKILPVGDAAFLYVLMPMAV